MNILVIGGTGNTGRHIVQQLIERGDSVRVLSRGAEQAKTANNIEMVSGSITDAKTISEAIVGMDGVVICVESANSARSDNAPDDVHYHGVINVIEATSGRDIHIVLVTQIYITRPEAFASVANVIAARDKGEHALRTSGLPYTIVRPSWLTNEPIGQQTVRLEQGDTGDGYIARADVAAACVHALHDVDARGKTFEMYNEPDDAQIDWHVLFKQLNPDI